MPILKWIDDQSLKNAVDHLIKKAKEAQLKAKNKFGKNVIDPFSAMFEIAGFEMNYDSWIKNETARQAQKTLQNHIGEFHQIILGSVGHWENMKTGNVIDLVSKERKIIAEIKNKFNTISYGKLSDLYHSLDELVMHKASIYKGYTAYYVPIIPKTPERYNKEFTPSNRDKGSRCPFNENIRETDGQSFYEIVTGEENALKNLYEAIPEIIFETTGNDIALKNKDQLIMFFSKAFA